MRNPVKDWLFEVIADHAHLPESLEKNKLMADEIFSWFRVNKSDNGMQVKSV
jgi:hypothetical protein